MSTTTADVNIEVPKRPRRKLPDVNRISHTLDKLGLAFFIPYVRLVAGDDPKTQIREILLGIILPAIAILAFAGFWELCARTVKTDSVAIPTIAQTWSAAKGMHQFAVNENAKEAKFAQQMEKQALKYEKGAAKVAASGDAAKAKTYTDKAAKFRSTPYAGPPTIYKQISTSLITVLIGFFAATLIAVPVGVLCGLSKYFNTAVNPLIQIFKPVSPLAWLPIVFVFVTALYEPSDSTRTLTRALFISAGTVTLCSLWPTLMNTAVGVAGIDKDHMNVAKVLKLSWWQRIVKIVLPAAVPLMFTGMRLSLGVGWMVLVAADMLAQNPGLGKFVWDTFQNGSTESMSQIIVAIFIIGIIGFFLDRIMFVCQKLVTFEDQTI